MSHAPRAYGIAPPGFILPDDTRLGVVRLQVSDLERSLADHQHVLGFSVSASTSASVTLAAEGGLCPLIELHTRRGVTPARRGALGLFHFAILLPDRAALGRFAAHLAAQGVGAGMADHLVSEALYLWDPDGLGIEVYTDRPRSAWRQRGRELVMATQALDVRDLMAAGGEPPWQGMPAGTTIGHMHLHVGSLDEAAAFYHAALGLEKTVWTYPGALFLAAGGYHHHLGTNVWGDGSPASEGEARLIEWELVVPGGVDARSLRDAGYAAEAVGSDITATDPWGTKVRVVTV